MHFRARWAFILFALLLLAVGGASVFHTPEYEIFYNTEMLAVPNPDGARTVICSMDVGNTGRNLQSVEICFKTEMLHNIIKPVRARTFGITDRPLQRRGFGKTIIYTIKDIESEKQVEVRFMLRIPAGEPLPEWEDFLINVKPERGRVLTGSPGMIKLLRFISVFL